MVRVSAPVSPLNHGALAAAVRSGTPTLGTFIGSASPIAAEVCAAAGVDWVLLDLEHGAGGEEQVRDVVPVIPHADLPGAGVWWDVAPAEVSTLGVTAGLRAEYESDIKEQRWFG